MMIGLRDVAKVAVLALGLSSGAAFANLMERESGYESVAVSYAELDLSNPVGAEALYDRLQRAAQEVCGVNQRPSSTFYTAGASERKACYQDALDRAVAQVDQPLVTEQHSG